MLQVVRERLIQDSQLVTPNRCGVSLPFEMPHLEHPDSLGYLQISVAFLAVPKRPTRPVLATPYTNAMYVLCRVLSRLDVSVTFVHECDLVSYRDMGSILGNSIADLRFILYSCHRA